MSRTTRLIFLIGLILSLALSACGAPAPTAAPAMEAVEVTAVATEAPTEAPAAIALKVTGSVANEQTWTEDEIKAMQTIEVEAANKKGEKAKYTGVLISDLLAKAKPATDANLVTFIADDGFTAEIALADVVACTNCIVSFRDQGGFSTVLPDQPGKLQVKGVVEIQVSISEVAAPEPPANPNIILATTTSTQDSGLLDVLVPMFEKQTGYTVQTIAVGSGEAMKMGEEGNADILLVHAPAAEKTFMEAGNGTDRFLVMHNDFILVGPAADPAGIKGMSSAAEAFNAIYKAGSPFITRGDDSGTHKKELALWKSAELDPAGQTWYIETGQGMGASMTVASEKEAYILTDRATYLANQDNYELAVLVEGDNSLLNVYHVITIDQTRWPEVNYEGALAFAKFMIDPDTQEVIGQFGVEKFGQPLFYPDADKTDADLGI
jgi:tungstate transport system substrate-binding protein